MSLPFFTHVQWFKLLKKMLHSAPSSQSSAPWSSLPQKLPCRCLSQSPWQLPSAVSAATLGAAGAASKFSLNGVRHGPEQLWPQYAIMTFNVSVWYRMESPYSPCFAMSIFSDMAGLVFGMVCRLICLISQQLRRSLTSSWYQLDIFPTTCLNQFYCNTVIQMKAPQSVAGSSQTSSRIWNYTRDAASTLKTWWTSGHATK